MIEHISMVVKKDAADIRLSNYKRPEPGDLLKQMRTAANYDERMKAVQSFNKVCSFNWNAKQENKP